MKEYRIYKRGEKGWEEIGKVGEEVIDSINIEGALIIQHDKERNIDELYRREERLELSKLEKIETTIEVYREKLERIKEYLEYLERERVEEIKRERIK